MKSNLLLQRCPLGRSVKMPQWAEATMVGVGTQAAGEAMITTPKVAVEATTEEDMETRELEEVAAERGRFMEQMEVEEGEAVTTRATIRMHEVIREEEAEVVMEEEGTPREAFWTLGIMGEEVEEVVTMTITTKTEAGIKREAGVEGVGEAGEGEAEEEEEEDKGEAGEEEVGRILTREDSLNSSSNTGVSTTTKLALIKADTTLVKDKVWGGHIRVHSKTDCFCCLNGFKMPYLMLTFQIKLTQILNKDTEILHTITEY